MRRLACDWRSHRENAFHLRMIPRHLINPHMIHHWRCLRKLRRWRKREEENFQLTPGLSEFLNDSQPVSSTSPSFKFIFVQISDEHISTIHQVVAWSCSPLKIHSHDNHKNKRAEHRVCCHSSKLVSSFVGTRRHILHHKYYHETVTFVCLSLASRRAGPSPFLHSNLGRKKI